MSKWKSNASASKRVIELLEQAGVHLELQTTEVCKGFCAINSVDKKVHFTSEKIVYSSSQFEQEYRELDQCVQIYEEIEIGKITGIQLIVNAPIECKYRKDVEYFAFIETNKTLHKRFPLHGDFNGSTYFSLLAQSLETFSNLQVANLVSLEIKNGDTPNRVHEENLIYNATGALYDFILFDLAPEGNNASGVHEFASQILDDMGLLQEFENYLNKTRYHWEYVLDNWISTVSDKECKLFSKRFFGGKRIYHSIHAHLPIVCVNGQINSVALDLESNINSFSEIPLCITSIRKRGWPGHASSGLMIRTPEIPVVITNPENLRGALDVVKDWHKNIRDILTDTPEKIITRWPLEAYFYHKARDYFHHNGTRQSYRSDHDLEV